MDSTRTTKKFEMFQNYILKYKKLKHNLHQSENLAKEMKLELLKLGSSCNTLLLSVTSITSELSELKLQLPQREKELTSAKEELKRIQYKTEKAEIKQKEYEERGKRFQEMYIAKQTKNLALKEKILKLEQKLSEEKEQQKSISTELNAIESSENKEKEVNPFRSYRSSIQFNPCDEMELKILTNESLTKKLRQEKEEIERKNIMLKSNINKIENQLQEIQNFMDQNTSLPNFNENKHEILTLNTEKNRSELKEGEKLLIKKNIKLPIHIVNSLKNFNSLKSKTIIEPLIEKYTTISELESVFVENLEENYTLISQLSKINSTLESEIVQENSKISSFAIKGKKYTEKHRKSII